MPVLDSVRITHLAARLDRRAVELAQASARLRAGAEQLSWRSPAARAGASSISGVLQLLARCHRRCLEAAATLRHHGSTAADRKAALSRLEGTVAKVLW
jgi:hypothetical protein